MFVSIVVEWFFKAITEATLKDVRGNNTNILEQRIIRKFLVIEIINDSYSP